MCTIREFVYYLCAFIRYTFYVVRQSWRWAGWGGALYSFFERKGEEKLYVRAESSEDMLPSQMKVH